jgi:Tol biopolymer transport system component
VGLVAVDGSGERSLTAELDRNVEQPRFAPDGQSLLFVLEDGGNKHVARVPVAGGPVERVLGGERDVQRLAVGRDGALVVR